MKIVFIQTGGTIDKDYPKTTKGQGFEIGLPAVQRILTKLNPAFDYHIITCCQKDSLDITMEDRERLCNIILHHDENVFIITHGTDTIIDTALFISERIKNQIVVLTGAMRPEKFKDSDAGINIGIAIGACNTKTNGVYVAMHGIVKSATNIQRNLTTGQFY